LAEVVGGHERVLKDGWRGDRGRNVTRLQLFDPEVSLPRAGLATGARPNGKQSSHPVQDAHGMVAPCALQVGDRCEEGSRQGKGAAAGGTASRGVGRTVPPPHNSSLAPALEKECARCDAK